MILGTSGRPVVELGGTSCYRQFTKGDIVCSLQWLDIGGEDGPEPVAAIFPAHRRVDAGAYVIPQANAYAFFKPNGTPTAHLASAAFNAVQHINGFPDRMTGFRVMEVLLDAAPDLVAMPSTMPTNLQAQYDAQKPVYGIEAKATLNGKVIKESLI